MSEKRRTITRPATADDITAVAYREKDQALLTAAEFVDSHSIGSWDPADSLTENSRLNNPEYWRAFNVVNALGIGASRLMSEYGGELGVSTESRRPYSLTLREASDSPTRRVSDGTGGVDA